MTSGVYPRKPGAKAGRKPMFTEKQCQWIKDAAATGLTVKFLSSKLLCSEKTIRQVLNGTGAYRDMK